MMTLKKGLAVAALALTLPLAMASTSNAAPLAAGSAVTPLSVLQGDNSAVTQVQWRRRGGYGYGYRRGYGGWGVGAGLAAGALIGGAIAAGANPYYGPGYYAPAPVYVEPSYGGDGVAYCMRRYRSYDPASGTYLNNDGNRYPCP